MEANILIARREAGRKEVIQMKLKFIHIYVVDANNYAEAVEKFAVAKHKGEEEKYFETEVVKKIDDEANWLKTVSKQVLGK